MGRFSGIQKTRATGKQVPFFPLATAEYLLLHVQSCYRAERSRFYNNFFVVLAVDSDDPQAASPGDLHNVQYNVDSMGLEFAEQKVKALGLCLLGMSEEEFDSLPPDKAEQMFLTMFPDSGWFDADDQNEPLLLSSRTYPKESKEKRRTITQQYFDPLPEEDLEGYYEEFGELIAEHWKPLGSEGSDE